MSFPRLSEDDMRDLDYRVMGSAFEVHRQLGSLCDEAVYHGHLATSLATSGHRISREVPITLSFGSFTKTLFLDLVVNQSVIYELKAVAKLTSAHVSQLLNYLFLTNTSRGKLINFRPAKVESQFVNVTLETSERQRFAIKSKDWKGPSDYDQLIESLVLDWGTGLDQAHYTEAIIHSLGGPEAVIRQLPMRVDGESIGNQRFHLLGETAAFRITTFQKPSVQPYEVSLHKLLIPSPLDHIHWVNITHHEMILTTISR